MSMSPGTPEELSAASEELVAYLDDELDEAAVRRVEERLASEEGYRQELARLQKAWDCLDELPTTIVDEGFARSTVEMLVQAVAQEVAEGRAAEPVRRRVRWLVTGAMLLLAGLAGFVGFRILQPDPNERLVADLPVLENLEPYLQVDSLDFLRRLRDLKTFNDGEHSEETVTAAPFVQVPDDEADRRHYIEEQTPEAKAQLAVRQQRFAALSPAERSRVQKLYEELNRQEDAAELRSTLDRYYQWASKLSEGKRADLLALPVDQRVQRIEKMLDHQHQFRRPRLSAADQETIRTWQSERIAHYRSEVPNSAPDAQREPSGQMEHRWRLPPWFSNEELEILQERLSPQAQQQLVDSSDKRRLLLEWIWFVGMNRRRSMQDSVPGSEELERFFEEELSSDRRAELLSLPWKQMHQRLFKLYLDSIGWLDRPGGKPDSGKLEPPPGPGPRSRDKPRPFPPSKHWGRDPRPPGI